MDPRYLPFKKRGHFSTGKIVAIYFCLDNNGHVKVTDPCIVEVTKQGPYLTGRNPNFEFRGLDEYDDNSGLLFQEGENHTDGVLSFGMLHPGEIDAMAMQRLLPIEIPNVSQMWHEFRKRLRVDEISLGAAMAGGTVGKLSDIGIDPNEVTFFDEGDSYGNEIPLL